MTRRRTRTKRVKAPKFTGSRSNAGHGYLAHFEFDIYTADLEGEIETSFVDNTVINIYPPFSNDGKEHGIRQIELDRIPWRPGTLRPDYDRVRVKEITLGGGLGAPCNSLRVDVIPDRGLDFATRIVSQFVGLARWWTGQWWIGHDRRANFGLVRNGFEINEVGERLSGISTWLPIHGAYQIEHPFDLERFRFVRGNITHGQTIPLSVDLLYDAIYFHATRQLRRSALEAAIACEAAIGENARKVAESTQISKSRLKKALASDDFTVQLKRGISEIIGKSFNEECPEEFAQLELLRTVRGNVAHGSAPLIPAADGVREISTEDIGNMLRAAIALFQWLQRL